MAQKSGRLLTDGAKTRSLPRVPVTLPVRYRLGNEEKKQESYRGGWALDLSLGGMLLRSDAPVGLIESGTKLQVQFPVGKEWLTATGKVVWMQASPSDNSHLLGVCFADFDNEDGEKLERFVESRLST